MKTDYLKQFNKLDRNKQLLLIGALILLIAVMAKLLFIMGFILIGYVAFDYYSKNKKKEDKDEAKKR